MNHSQAFPVMAIIGISIIGCNILDRHGAIKPSEIDTISSSEVLARSEKAASFITKENSKLKEGDKSESLTKFAQEQGDMYSRLSRLRHNDPEIILANAYIYKAVMSRVLTLDPIQAPTVVETYNKIILRAFQNAAIESPVFPKIYKEIVVNETTRNKARQFAIYSLNHAKNPNDVINWMNESFKHTDSIPGNNPKERLYELEPLKIYFKKYTDNNTFDNSGKLQISQIMAKLQSAIDGANFELAEQKGDHDDETGPANSATGPKAASLQYEMESLKKKIADYITLNADPLEMTYSKKADGSNGMIPVEEAFEVSAKRIVAIAKEINSGEDISRYKLDYEDYKKSASQHQEGSDMVMIRNGILRDSGMTAAQFNTYYKCLPQFRMVTDAIFSGRKSNLDAMREVASRSGHLNQVIKNNDWKEIQQLKQLAADSHIK